MLTIQERKFLKRRLREIAQDLTGEVEDHLEVARIQEKRAKKGLMPKHDKSGSWHRRKADMFK